MTDIALEHAAHPGGNRPVRRRWSVLLWLGGLSAIALAMALAGQLATQRLLGDAARRGTVELDRHVESLTLEFARFDVLPELCALQDEVRQSLLQPHDAARIAAANRYLEQVGRIGGATALYVLDMHGVVVAASNWQELVSFVGIDLTYRPYFHDALQTGQARFYGIGTTSFTPGYYYARRLEAEGRPIGVAAVKIDLDTMQTGWGLRATEVMVVDQHGVVMLASRPALRYRTLTPLPPSVIAELRRTRQYEHAGLQPLDLDRTRLLAQEHPIGAAGWKVVVLSDIADVAAIAWGVRAVTGLGLATLALSLLYGGQRRRAAALARGARRDLVQAYGVLEQLVQTRTQDLQHVNARLRGTQDELVHAARLAALGQLAVGITHEINQPLAAMQTLTDNARTLLDRGETAEATANLSMIAELIRRMARMNGQLKLFARKAAPSFETIDVARCVSNSLLILSEKISRGGAAIHVRAAARSLILGDAARLEQVFVNLIGNALDATAGRADAAVSITVEPAGTQIRIEVGDNGGGVPEAAMARLFEPFFTTKVAGEGLGLGLSISEGIVRDFGGTLRAANDAAGAVFTVLLPALAPKAATPAAAPQAADV